MGTGRGREPIHTFNHTFPTRQARPSLYKPATIWLRFTLFDNPTLVCKTSITGSTPVAASTESPASGPLFRKPERWPVSASTIHPHFHPRELVVEWRGQGGAMRYAPELGQAVFGNQWQEHECPGYVDSHLSTIRRELERVCHNTGRRDEWRQVLYGDSSGNPFDNSGNIAGFVCDAFEAHAYDWGAADTEEGQPFNFKWRDLEISWYKYLGRGMSMNRETTPTEAAEMLDDCLACLRRWEWDNTPEERRWMSEPPQYPAPTPTAP